MAELKTTLNMATQLEAFADASAADPEFARYGRILCDGVENHGETLSEFDLLVEQVCGSERTNSWRIAAATMYVALASDLILAAGFDKEEGMASVVRWVFSDKRKVA